MTDRVIDRVMAIADRLVEQAAEAERLGRLPDETVNDLKSVGAIKLLQPKRYNGFEVHPREFAETVMAVASPAAARRCVRRGARYGGRPDLLALRRQRTTDG